MSEGIASTRPEPSGLHPGVVVGGRFEVIDQIDEDPQAVVWSAKDQQTKRAILVRVIRPELVSSEAAPEFREACRTAATLSHRNIARVFGVGRTPKGDYAAYTFNGYDGYHGGKKHPFGCFSFTIGGKIILIDTAMGKIIKNPYPGAK